MDFVSGAALNLIVLLGMAFVLSRGFIVLRNRPRWERTLILGLGFGATAIASMAVAFTIADGVIGDLRNAVIVIAALVGGPLAALVAASIAAAYRVYLGGHAGGALIGIAATAAIAIGFVRKNFARSTLNLALLGVTLAGANALLPFIGLAGGSFSLELALRISAVILVSALLLYPVSIVFVGGLLTGELRRIDEAEELRLINARLQEEERFFRDVFDLACVAMCWGDLKTGRWVRVNEEYSRFTGYSEAALRDMTFDQLAAPEDRQKNAALLRPLIEGAVNSFSDEKRYIRRDGTAVWGQRTVTVVRENGEPRYIFVIVEDITERRRSREQIAYLADHDPLTGLVNRLVFHDRVNEAAAAATVDSQAAVFYIDLDEFKEINDTLGHPSGDALLSQIARRLELTVGDAGLVARLGGDEFAILAAGKRGPDDFRALAQRVIDAVTTPYQIDGQTVTLGASIGIACAPADGSDSDELSKKADLALYVAKAGGLGAFCFFEPQMEASLRTRQALRSDLGNALANGELDVEYQPIVNIGDGRVASFEALLRWHHPASGLILPADFITLAEEARFIVSIGDWVLERACREAVSWPADINVAVNVSPAQFEGGTLPLRVAAVLSRTGLSPQRLELEITESVILQNSEANLANLYDLRKLGVRIALDDFGTGYSSLSYVRRFPFDKIKIDRSFLSDLMERPESRAIVRAVVGIGRALGVQITAEGIETEEQLERIRVKGCDEAQGFLFSPSVPATLVPELLANFAAAKDKLRSA